MQILILKHEALIMNSFVLQGKCTEDGRNLIRRGYF